MSINSGEFYADSKTVSTLVTKHPEKVKKKKFLKEL